MNPPKNPPAAAAIAPPTLLAFLTNHPTKRAAARATIKVTTQSAISPVEA